MQSGSGERINVNSPEKLVNFKGFSMLRVNFVLLQQGIRLGVFEN